MSYKLCDIYLKNSRKALFTEVRIPDSFYHKAKGLLGKCNGNTEMLFKQCSSIHMIGMKFPLDVLFLGKDGTILKCVDNLQPWRIAFCLKAITTLELAAGSINRLGLKSGMKLEIRDV